LITKSQALKKGISLDVLIVGILGAMAIFAAIHVKIKALQSIYVEGVNISSANILVSRYVKIYDNEDLSPSLKNEQLSNIIDEMRKHHENAMFVIDLAKDIPENVTFISQRKRA